MQYKRWVVRHRIQVDLQESGDELEKTDFEENESDMGFTQDIDNEAFGGEEENGVREWLKEWEKKERLGDKVTRLARSK